MFIDLYGVSVLVQISNTAAFAFRFIHYNDVIMSMMASQITSL